MLKPITLNFNSGINLNFVLKMNNMRGVKSILCENILAFIQRKNKRKEEEEDLKCIHIYHHQN